MSKHKRLITLLFLLSMLGQVFSYSSIACPVMSDGSGASLDSSDMDHSMTGDMDHSMHGTMSDMAPSDMPGDCCDPDGGCTMSGCSASALCSHLSLSNEQRQSCGVISPYFAAWVSAAVPSLYRPPISS